MECFRSLSKADSHIFVRRSGSVSYFRAPALARSLLTLTDPPLRQKSINKCVVSRRSAVGIGLSGMSEEAAECEIEFRTERRARGGEVSVCFCLFIHMAPAFRSTSARTAPETRPSLRVEA